MTTLTSDTPARWNTPRPRTATWLSRAWKALEAAGQRRAAGELRRAAALHAGIDPELAARLRAAADTLA